MDSQPYELVAAAISDGLIEEALVRLWLLAGHHDGMDRALNRWLRFRSQDRKGAAAEVRPLRTLIQRLQGAESISADDVRADPLAMVQALDEFLAERTSRYMPDPGAIAIDNESFWVVPTGLPRRAESVHAKQIDKPNALLRRHWIVPSEVTLSPGRVTIRIRVRTASRRASVRVESLLGTNRGIRLGVARFGDGVTTEVEGGERVRAIGLSDAERRRGSLSALLDATRHHGLHFLVMPELTITPDLQQTVAANLSRARSDHLIFVAAGSFHEQAGEVARNRARLLDWEGQTILTHDKLTVFGHRDGQSEDISQGSQLEVLATPIGVVALSICRDYCDEGMAPLWTAVGADWHLVPSMSDSVSAHKSASQRVHREQGAVSAIANQEPPGRDDSVPGYLFPSGNGSRVDGDLFFADHPPGLPPSDERIN